MDKASTIRDRCNRRSMKKQHRGDINVTRRKEAGFKDHSLDLTHLIRSIQRLEGHPDCFHSANGYCDRLDCAWRVYCLKEPQKTAADKREDI